MQVTLAKNNTGNYNKQAPTTCGLQGVLYLSYFLLLFAKIWLVAYKLLITPTACKYTAWWHMGHISAVQNITILAVPLHDTKAG